MACRDLTRAGPAAEDIRRETGSELVEVMELDLSSLQSVRDFASAFKAKGLRLHIVMNNAAVMACPFSQTEDGVETHMGTNHLGHFYLTMLLFDLLEQSQPSRIINVSSMAHRDFTNSGGIHYDTLNDPKHYGINRGYGESKLANIYFTQELAKRVRGKRIYTNTLHPGATFTELQRNYEKLMPGWVSAFLLACMKPFLYLPADGALTQLYLATHPDVERLDIRGQFYLPIARKAPYALGTNEVMAQKLWEWTVALVKEKDPNFELPEDLRD